MAPSDQELVDRCLQGDERAWLLLTDLLRWLIGGLAATRWLEGGLQEEIAREVEAELRRDEGRLLRRYASRSHLSTYLGTLILRVALHLHRADGPISWGELELMNYPMEIADTQFRRIEAWAMIQQMLSPLEVLILRPYAAKYAAEEGPEMLK